MSETQEWMDKHKGPLVRTVGMVWECYDDECGCTQAQIISYYRNKVVWNAVVPVVDWEGEFHTDHESGADEELAVHRRQLKLQAPEREASIQWQNGVDYDAKP